MTSTSVNETVIDFLDFSHENEMSILNLVGPIWSLSSLEIQDQFYIAFACSSSQETPKERHLILERNEHANCIPIVTYKRDEKPVMYMCIGHEKGTVWDVKWMEKRKEDDIGELLVCCDNGDIDIYAIPCTTSPEKTYVEPIFHASLERGKVLAMAISPYISSQFLAGDSMGRITLWDSRDTEMNPRRPIKTFMNRKFKCNIC